MNPPDCGVLERTSLRLLEIRGEDRQRFLNGQVTCEVKGLEPGKTIPGFFTNIKGRIQADVTVLALDDRLWLELPAGRVDAIREHLEKYILADRVEIQRRQEEAITLLGTKAGALLPDLARQGVHAVPAEELSDLGGGVAVYTLWTPQAARESVLKALADAGATSLEPAAFDALRVAAGVPLFGRDFGPDNFPQETGREAAISYTKGCYLGQEVVARLHYRGQVSRQLRRLQVEPGAGGVEEGAELLFEGRPAGTLTSLAGPPYLEQTLALAIVQRRAFDPGTRLEVAGGGSAVILTDDEKPLEEEVRCKTV